MLALRIDEPNKLRESENDCAGWLGPLHFILFYFFLCVLIQGPIL